MEKVLEYLKQKRKEFVGYEDQFIDEVIALDKAIVTLEELMKPKTCEGCKHYEEKQCTNENSIAFGGINAVYTDDFCNDFESKDDNDTLRT